MRAAPAKRAVRVTREDAVCADRAAFADTRPDRRAGTGDGKRATRPPRDGRPEDRAAPTAAARPKRFYDARPKRDARPEETGAKRPERVFNAELGRNVRAKKPRPPRNDAAEKRPTTPAAPPKADKPVRKSGWAKARPPRTRK
jgi:hypothetical protein